MDTVVVVILLGFSADFARRAWVYIPYSDWFYAHFTGMVTCMFMAWLVSSGGIL